MKYNEKVIVDLTGRKGKLAEPLWIRTKLFSNSEFAFCIPEGFETDFASIPRVFWTFISPTDKDILVGAIAHDYIYKTLNKKIEGHLLIDKILLAEKVKIVFNRKLADKLLKEKMKSFKANFFKRWVVYLTVRTFGWMFYKTK